MKLSALWLSIVAAVVSAGCSSTYITARATENPLDAVAASAADEYAVERIDENTLRLRDSWVWSSIGGIGWYRSVALLHFNEASSELQIRYELRANGWWTLWFTTCLHAEKGSFGAALKSTMNGQIRDILNWADATLVSRRQGEPDEQFPGN